MKEILATAQQLRAAGHTVLVPHTAELLEKGEMTQTRADEEKSAGDVSRVQTQDLIRRHYKKIVAADAILVLNLEKKGIPGYIGGNVFLEIGFAHVLGKKIFLLNPIPEVSYKDEIVAMVPTFINGDLTRIQ